MRLPRFIKKIIGCTDNESSRYALGGVKCEFNGEQSTCVATDGRQLIAVTYADDSGGESFDAVVDGKSLSKAVTAVTSGKKDLALIAHDNGAVRVDGVTGSASLRPNGLSAKASTIDGRFPRYEDVFAGIYGEDIADFVCVKLDPDLLSELLAACSAAQSEANKGVYMWVNRARAVTSAVYLHMHGEDGELVRAAIMPLAPDDGTTGARCCKAYPKPGERTQPADDLTPEPEPVVSGGPPECLDDDVIAAAVSAEPEPVGVGSWIPAVS